MKQNSGSLVTPAPKHRPTTTKQKQPSLDGRRYITTGTTQNGAQQLSLTEILVMMISSFLFFSAVMTIFGRKKKYDLYQT